MQERKTIQQTDTVELQYKEKKIRLRMNALSFRKTYEHRSAIMAIQKELERRENTITFINKNLDTGVVTREDVTLGGL